MCFRFFLEVPLERMVSSMDALIFSLKLPHRSVICPCVSSMDALEFSLILPHRSAIGLGVSSMDAFFFVDTSS